jgi:hypothetical protein
MYAPATPALLTAPALPPNAIAVGEAGAPPTTAAPVRTVLRVRRAVVNVLDGRVSTVAGALLVEPRRTKHQPAGATQPVEGSDSTGGGSDSQPVGIPPRPASTSQPRGVAHSANVAARTVVLQARGRHGWRTIAAARTGAHWRFRLRYRTDRIGSEHLRVRFAGATGERRAQRDVGRLNVYRLVEASWYGGGGSLACGGWLTSATMGVANKTLPCGTLVTLRYGGHTVRVPVVDRGPYVAGREYDLTEATKRALGFEGVGEVWATR